MERTAFVWSEYGPDEKQRIVGALKQTHALKVGNLGDIRLYECPLRWITLETNAVLRAVYLAMDSGVLYTSGGWIDQPDWFVEAYDIVRTETLLWQKKKKSR